MALSSETELRLAGASSGSAGLAMVFCWHATAKTPPTTSRVRGKKRIGSSRLPGRLGRKHAACRDVSRTASDTCNENTDRTVTCGGRKVRDDEWVWGGWW